MEILANITEFFTNMFDFINSFSLDNVNMAVLPLVLAGAEAGAAGAGAAGAAGGSGLLSKIAFNQAIGKALSGGGESGGGIGNLVGKMGGAGNALQIGIGAAQSILGAIKQKKADAALPSREDAEQRMLLDQLRRRKRAFQTGTAFAAQRNNLLKMQQQGLQQAAKMGGGMRGVNMLANALNNASISLEDKAINAELNIGKQEQGLLDKMAQRRADTQKIIYDREQARAAKLKQAGNRNLMGGLAKAVKVKGGLYGGEDYSTKNT